VAHDGHRLALMCANDFPQGRFDARKKLVPGFGVRNRRRIEFLQPVERANAKLAVNLFPSQARPVAEIHFTKTRCHHGGTRTVTGNRRKRLLGAAHRADVNGIDGALADVASERRGLLLAARGKLHINAASGEHPVIAIFDFTMTDEEQTNRMYHVDASCARLGQRSILQFDESANAGLAKAQHLGQLRFAKCRFLAVALDFNELAGPVHDEI